MNKKMVKTSKTPLGHVYNDTVRYIMSVAHPMFLILFPRRIETTKLRLHISLKSFMFITIQMKNPKNHGHYEFECCIK